MQVSLGSSRKKARAVFQTKQPGSLPRLRERILMKDSIAALFILAVSLPALGVGDELAQRPSRDLPELAALQYLIGTFDTAVVAPTRARVLRHNA